MKMNFPMVASMTLDEAKIVHQALLLYRADKLQPFYLAGDQDGKDKQEVKYAQAAAMACELADHIEHFEYLDEQCGDVVSQYFPGGIHS